VTRPPILDEPAPAKGLSQGAAFALTALLLLACGGVAESNALTAGFLGDVGFDVMPSNDRATVASTHAELTGDETLTIATSMP